MAATQNIQTPGIFGGLMRYDEEIGSKIQLSPMHVIAFIISILLFGLALRLVF